ncbi:MAG: O-antigen polymerase [Parcubacteria group bacterium LiPW_39]|nr:MAG: O-antigen polymerase [Parcubacteria group bacterium LiPW_39]
MNSPKTGYGLAMFLGAMVLGLGIFWLPKLILGLLILAALGLFFYYWSETAFYLLVAYLPFQVALNLAPGIDLLSGRVLILLLAAVWLIKLFQKKELPNFKNQAAIGLILFFILALISLLGAAQPDWGWRKLLLFLSIFPLFFLAADLIDSRRKIKKIIYVIVGGATFSALIALAQFLAQFIWGSQKIIDFWALKVAPLFYGQTTAGLVAQNPSWLVEMNGQTLMRAIGLFPDPHMLAFFLGLVLPFVLALIFFEEKHRLLLFTVGCLLFTVLLLTFSRGGYLGLVASLIVVILLVWQRLKRESKPRTTGSRPWRSVVRGKVFLGSLIGLALIVGIIFGAPVISRFFSSFDLGEGSNIGRLQIWQESLAVAKEHLLLGVGLGNYPAEVDFSGSYRSAITSHNLYLDILAEMGIFGLLAWFWFLGGAGLAALKEIKQEELAAPALGILAALIYFAVHSFFETAIFNPTVLAFLMIVVGLAVSLNKERRQL